MRNENQYQFRVTDHKGKMVVDVGIASQKVITLNVLLSALRSEGVISGITE